MKNKYIIYILIFLFLLLLTGCTKKHTHNYSLEWEWGKEVIAIFTCDCGEDSTQKLLASTKEEVIAEADCINDGEINVTAKVIFNNVLYEKTKIVTIPKKGHDFVTYESKAATCTEKGWRAYECTRCDYITYKEIATLNHNLVTHESKAATCTEKGHEAYEDCTMCDYTTYKEISALDHDISIVVIEPGFVSAGYTVDICSRCNYIFNQYAHTSPILKLECIYFSDYYVVYGVNDYNVSEIVIPKEYKGSIVQKIGDGAFSHCKSLTNITIPDSVTSIGEEAFLYCSSLTNITIPDGVTSIGNNAFAGCTSLTSITIPDSVTSIGENAFSSSSTIYCEATQQPSGWHSSWNGLYRPVYWGINEINFYEENGIQYVLNTETKEATISRYVGHDANIVINETVIVNDIEYSVRSIGEYAFYDCRSLESIVIPDSVTSIGNNVFAACTNLTSIVIPDSVTSIGEKAFLYCSSLENVYYNGTLEDWFNIKFSYYNSNPMTYAIHFYMKDSNNEYYEVTELEIPNTVTSIGDYKLFGFDNITSVVIPNSVTSIGSQAFGNCTSLTSIEIPNSVTSIGSSAFYNCSSLESIVIPDSVTSIGYYVFEYCKSLTNITIPESVTSIGDYAFKDCSSLKSIVIPDSVTSIGEYAFYDCRSLESIVIPDSVTSIDRLAFEGCSRLTIYCEATSKPSGWSSYWNFRNCPVVWGYK